MLEPTKDKGIVHAFIAELREKRDVDASVFFIDCLHSLKEPVAVIASISDMNAMESE